jgi:hypothetical protein
MDFGNILSTALATLIMLVVIHIAVFWMIRTLYPPTVRQPEPVSPPPQVRFAPEKTETFMQPPVLEQSQVINVPTYEAPIHLEAANEAGITNINDVLQGTTG